MPLRYVLDSTRKHDITFNANSGCINITKRIVEIMGIEEGDSINILADDYETYLTVRKHSEGTQHTAVCYCSNSSAKCKHMRVTCKRLCSYMQQRFGSDIVKLSAGSPQTHKDFGRVLPLINRNLA